MLNTNTIKATYTTDRDCRLLSFAAQLYIDPDAWATLVIPNGLQPRHRAWEPDSNLDSVRTNLDGVGYNPDNVRDSKPKNTHRNTQIIAHKRQQSEAINYLKLR